MSKWWSHPLLLKHSNKQNTNLTCNLPVVSIQLFLDPQSLSQTFSFRLLYQQNRLVMNSLAVLTEGNGCVSDIFLTALHEIKTARLSLLQSRWLATPKLTWVRDKLAAYTEGTKAIFGLWTAKWGVNKKSHFYIFPVWGMHSVGALFRWREKYERKREKEKWWRMMCEWKSTPIN